MRGNEGHGSQSIIELGYERNPVINLDNQYTYPIKQADPKHKSYNNLPYKTKKAYRYLIACSGCRPRALCRSRSPIVETSPVPPSQR